MLDAAPQLLQAELPLYRDVYERMVRDHHDGRVIPATITTTVDAPLGSGLGSSSALVVALVDAFRALLGAPLGQYDVAHLAFEIERLDMGLAGGKQDQYAAAFGGTNFIEFLANDRVIVNPLRVSDSARNEFESTLVICFSGGDGSPKGRAHRNETCAARRRYFRDGTDTGCILAGEEDDGPWHIHRPH